MVEVGSAEATNFIAIIIIFLSRWVDLIGGNRSKLELSSVNGNDWCALDTASLASAARTMSMFLKGMLDRSSGMCLNVLFPGQMRG